MIRRFHKLVGYEYKHNNKSLLLQLIYMTKENFLFTEDELKNMIEITSNFLDKTSRNLESPSKFFGNILEPTSYIEDHGIPLYKFIPQEVYQNHILKGHFRLGSLKYYREIENESSKDPKEGFSNIIINSGNRQIFTSLISGFDQYVFCGTYTLEESVYMSKRFGGVVIKIKNLRSFAEKIKNAIGAQKWYSKKVTYSDLKAYKVKQLIEDLNGVGPDLSVELFKYLLSFSTVPSVFSNPARFAPEQEIRLSFEMNKNTKRKLDICNKALLKEIELIK